MVKSSLWNNLSIAKKLYFVVGIMAILILVELVTLRFAMVNLSAVRAFVGGEGLWSKGQKQAIYQLQRYSLTKDEKDFLEFKNALIVSDGDHIARIELEKKEPNLKIVHLGFKQGRIHEDDIDGMINLLKRFHGVSYINEAIAAWTAGDNYIAELKALGDDYHAFVQNGAKQKEDLLKLSNKLKVLNDKLSTVTDRFSEVLSEGSRWVENIVFLILISLVLTVETVGLTLTFFTSRAISSGLADLNDLALKIGKGQFTERLKVQSQDEIGHLTASVNNMGSMLEMSYRDLKRSHQELEEKIQDRTSKLEEIARENADLYKEAKLAVRMRDEFFSIASHELRTPISALNLQIQFLERLVREPMDENSIKKIGDVSAKAFRMSKRLANLQDILMDLTRLRLNKFELKKETCDLVALVHDCASALGADAADAGALLSVKSNLPIIARVDSTRIGQVITNLISNSIKYGQGTPVEITVYSNANEAIISVKDHGPGIPEEMHEKVFERFERINADDKVTGLGLGLYITKQIVEKHSGRVRVKSHPDEGTQFIVKLPLV